MSFKLFARKLFFSMLALLLALATFSVSHRAEARRRRVRHHRSKLKVINEKNLYERIGGVKVMNSVVDDWLRADLADQRLAGPLAPLSAKPDRLGKFRHAMNDELCGLSDGPCADKEGFKRDAPALNDDQFLVLADNLFRSLQKYSVPEREKNELLARFSEIKPDLVHGASRDTAASRL